jgi:ATP-dependent DNA helicase RecG
VPDIEIVPYRKAQLLAIHVHPSSLRPHCLVKAGWEKGVYVRVGSTNRLADKELIESLRREVRLESFDEQPLPGRNSEAIDFRAASECFAPIRRFARRDMQTLKITVLHQGRQVASVGGILLFGKERDKDFPDAWIQAGAFAGKDKSHITDSQEIRGHLTQLIDPAISFVSRHIRQGVDVVGSRHAVKSEVPPLAIRESLINALVHSDYAQKGAPIRVAVFDDRIEVENPGLLPFGLTIEEAKSGVSKVRNRVLARVFKELGYIEQWGSGLQRILSVCKEAGLDEPRFEEVGTRFRVILRRTGSVAKPDIDPKDLKILRALRERGGLQTHQVARVIGLSERATSSRLKSLVARGLVKESSMSAKDPKKKYLVSAK